MAKLSPIMNASQFVNGIPASGAKLFTYAAGSSTKQTTYKDKDGTVAHTNPIILDSRGEPDEPIWLTEGLSYKFILAPSDDTDPPSSPIRSIDDISGTNDASVALSQWVDSGDTPSYVNATQFTMLGDKTSDYHVNRRIKLSVTAGTVYGYISATAYTSLTTVTVTLDSGTLDAGLSSVALSLLTFINPSIPNIDYTQSSDATAVASDKVLFKDVDDNDNLKTTTVSSLLALTPSASESTSGLVEKATAAEAQAFTADKFIDGARLKEAFNAAGSAPFFACRAFGNFNGTGTPAYRSSGNMSGTITDRGTGQYSVSFTENMPNSDYLVIPMWGRTSNTTAYAYNVNIHNQSASGFDIDVKSDGNSYTDLDSIGFAVFA